MVTSEEGQTLTYRRWHQELELLLIGQGLHGGKQSEIIKHFDGVALRDDVIAYLELLLKEDKAQKFHYTRNVYWRATVNILDEAYRKEGNGK
jgi:hypothetical protein